MENLNDQSHRRRIILTTGNLSIGSNNRGKIILTLTLLMKSGTVCCCQLECKLESRPADRWSRELHQCDSSILVWLSHPGKRESITSNNPSRHARACTHTHNAQTHVSTRPWHSYHLHPQFPDLLIQTLLPRLFSGVESGAHLGVNSERGCVLAHPPEQTLGGLPADFYLNVFQIGDGLAGTAFLHRVRVSQTKRSRRTETTSASSPLGNCCWSHFL